MRTNTVRVRQACQSLEALRADRDREALGERGVDRVGSSESVAEERV